MTELYTQPYPGFPSDSESEEPACSVGDLGSIPRSGRFPGEGKDHSLQYSRLENPVDGGAWRAAVRGVAEADTTEQQHVCATSSVCPSPGGH